ncbi:MAG: hypothetical protein ABIF06_01295 [bacterium]
MAKFESPTPLSDDELKNLSERNVSDAELYKGGAGYVNSESGPRLELTDEQMEQARAEMDTDLAGRPEVAATEAPEVQKIFIPLTYGERKVSNIDAVLPFVKENNPELGKEFEMKREVLDSEAQNGEYELELARLRAENEEFNKIFQKSKVMSTFGHDHGFNKEETYNFVENKVLENEGRIRELEQNKNLLDQESKEVEKRNEIAQLKSEIDELNRIVQQSEVMEQFGHDHGFNKDETYRFVEESVLEKERKIRELEGGEKEEDIPVRRRNMDPIPKEAEKVMVESFEEARGKKDWWGWVKERVKGLATFGFWEFHQAERFRSNKKDIAKEIAEAGERINKTKDLSMEDALVEAEAMKLMAEGEGVMSPESPDYESYSRRVSGRKIEENNEHIATIVASASADVRERLAKYRDQFGKAVADDERIIAGFEGTLRNSLIDLQNGQKESDVKEFDSIIKNRLDPTYWSRYVYGALETALGAWGFNVLVSKLASSNWWLGKKAVEGSSEMLDIKHTSDQIPMHDTIWQSSKEWLQQRGIMNPSNEEVMNLSKKIATDNGIGVNEWGIPGNPLDTHMQQGFLLKFTSAPKILMAIRAARGITSLM